MIIRRRFRHLKRLRIDRSRGAETQRKSYYFKFLCGSAPLEREFFRYFCFGCNYCKTVDRSISFHLWKKPACFDPYFLHFSSSLVSLNRHSLPKHHQTWSSSSPTTWGFLTSVVTGEKFKRLTLTGWQKADCGFRSFITRGAAGRRGPR